MRLQIVLVEEAPGPSGRIWRFRQGPPLLVTSELKFSKFSLAKFISLSNSMEAFKAVIGS